MGLANNAEKSNRKLPIQNKKLSNGLIQSKPPLNGGFDNGVMSEKPFTYNKVVSSHLGKGECVKGELAVCIESNRSSCTFQCINGFVRFDHQELEFAVSHVSAAESLPQPCNR